MAQQPSRAEKHSVMRGAGYFYTGHRKPVARRQDNGIRIRQHSLTLAADNGGRNLGSGIRISRGSGGGHRKWSAAAAAASSGQQQAVASLAW